jgi:hypothetical protein
MFEKFGNFKKTDIPAVTDAGLRAPQRPHAMGMALN